MTFEHGNVIGLLLKSTCFSRVLSGAVSEEAWAGSPGARGSGALRPIVRCRFEPPVPIGKKAVHRFASLIIASAVAITPAQAQTASELRVSGTVEKLGGNLAALSLSQGISLVVRLDSEPRVNSVAKGSGSDLKTGSQVSIQAKSNDSGDLVATQIVLFAPGSNRPDAESGPDNAQRVATIKNTNSTPEGPVLTVADNDGDRKITIGPDTAIWIARAARITDIKVGSAVTMTGVKREDGSLQVLRATIAPAGAGNPPL
jgi:hypothetical protein